VVRALLASLYPDEAFEDAPMPEVNRSHIGLGQAVFVLIALASIAAQI
jgi:hypothetical protein